MPIKREMMVRKDALEQTAINETLAPEPKDGEVLLEVEAFAITANNVTYAVVGEQVKYWDFFPTAEGWGIVPVWGHARVTASAHPDIAVGERLYGYLPMATHLIVQRARFRRVCSATWPRIVNRWPPSITNIAGSPMIPPTILRARRPGCCSNRSS